MTATAIRAIGTTTTAPRYLLNLAAFSMRTATVIGTIGISGINGQTTTIATVIATIGAITTPTGNTIVTATMAGVATKLRGSPTGMKYSAPADSVNGGVLGSLLPHFS